MSSNMHKIEQEAYLEKLQRKLFNFRFAVIDLRDTIEAAENYGLDLSGIIGTDLDLPVRAVKFEHLTGWSEGAQKRALEQQREIKKSW